MARHIGEIIGDPLTFVNNMIRADENIPPRDPPRKELNQREYIKQWEERENKNNNKRNGRNTRTKTHRQPQ